MRDIQTVFGYFYTVYTLTAVILGGYVLWMVGAARKAQARIAAASRR
jgi:hypothetical protein